MIAEVGVNWDGIHGASDRQLIVWSLLMIISQRAVPAFLETRLMFAARSGKEDTEMMEGRKERKNEREIVFNFFASGKNNILVINSLFTQSSRVPTHRHTHDQAGQARTRMARNQLFSLHREPGTRAASTIVEHSTHINRNSLKNKKKGRSS